MKRTAQPTTAHPIPELLATTIGRQHFEQYREAPKRYDTWIRRRLCFVGDGAMADAVAEVLTQLPPAVCQFAVHEIGFFLVGQSIGGYALPTVGEWLPHMVLLADARPDLVAHEVCHCWLGFESPGKADHPNWDAVVREHQAASLARALGFTGDAADPLLCALGELEHRLRETPAPARAASRKALVRPSPAASAS